MTKLQGAALDSHVARLISELDALPLHDPKRAALLEQKSAAFRSAYPGRYDAVAMKARTETMRTADPELAFDEHFAELTAAIEAIGDHALAYSPSARVRREALQAERSQICQLKQMGRYVPREPQS